MPATGGYKRYCSEACRAAHAARDARMAAVYLRVPAIAKATDTDPDLLKMVLELDARRADGSDGASGARLAKRAWAGSCARFMQRSAIAAPEANCMNAISEHLVAVLSSFRLVIASSVDDLSVIHTQLWLQAPVHRLRSVRTASPPLTAPPVRRSSPPLVQLAVETVSKDLARVPTDMHRRSCSPA